MGSRPEYVLIATAGHVDHGKTALVRMLTGIETDTLKEEKERGLTVDAGFAPCELRDGRKACIVDLPGHERLVRNMVAGVSGVDIVLLVVAADDSVMPQTIEHLRIAAILGIERGLVALTKTDLVDEEIRELAVEEVRDLLEGTFLEGAPVHPVSTVTGEGCEGVWQSLAEVAETVRERPAEGAFRMPVHRAFSPPGIGTVVTGMPAGGRISVGDCVELLPAGLSGRVRAMEYHGAPVTEGRAGQCLALVLSGIKWGSVARGDVVAAPGHFTPHSMAEVRVRVLPDAPRPLEHHAPVRLHVGTALVCGRIFPLECDRVEPGGSALAQFRGDGPLVVAPGDRFVLGQYSPVVTIGGGRILGAGDRKQKRFRAPAIRALASRELVLDDERATVALLLEEAGAHALRVEEIVSRSFLVEKRVRAELSALEKRGSALAIGTGGAWVSGRAFAALTCRVLDAVRSCHERHPRRRGVGLGSLKGSVDASDHVLKQVIRDLGEGGRIVLEEGFLRDPGHEGWLTSEQDATARRVERILAHAGLTPPPSFELAERTGAAEDQVRRTLALLAGRGLAVRLSDEVYAHPDPERRARRLLVGWLRERGHIGVVDFRDLIRASRRYAYLWLDHFDEVGLTRRVENLRYLRDASQDGGGPGRGSRRGAR